LAAPRGNGETHLDNGGTSNGSRAMNNDFTSHLGQDAWVAGVFRHKRSGYFLDFGALDGQLTSNSFYLEKCLGWSGICVEPNPGSYAALCKSRNCITANVALWPESRQSLRFLDAHGLSCFAHLVDDDSNAKTRREITRQEINVDTLNPTELLDRFAAPHLIEYMSLDVEGAEMDVLGALDLDKYKIALMTIEHSENAERKAALIEYLAKFGYEFINCYYDAYFFNRSILSAIGEFADPVLVAEDVAKNYVIYDR
jgi:FkbM family methyltransferase